MVRHPADEAVLQTLTLCVPDEPQAQAGVDEVCLAVAALLLWFQTRM